MEETDAKKLRRTLAARRDELNALLERIHSNIKRGYDPNSRERATELEDQDVVDTLGNEAVGELMLIKATLDRLDAGHYGICLACSDEIIPDRLHAYPYASLCFDCAEDEERQLRRA